jgi:hypothetical protein
MAKYVPRIVESPLTQTTNHQVRMDLYKITVYLTIGSPLVPLLFYANHFRKLPPQSHFVGALLLASLLTEIIAFVLIRFGEHTILLNNGYDICSFLFLSIFYYRLYLCKKGFKEIIIIGSIIYSSSLIYFIYAIGLSSPHTTLWFINGIIIGTYGLMYFVLLPRMVVERLLDKNLYSYQIMNSSLVFYLLTTLLLFLSTEYVFEHLDSETSRLFWSFHNIANTLKNIGLAIGLYYTGRRDVTTTLLEIERIGRERSGEARDPLWTNSLKR